MKKGVVVLLILGLLSAFIFAEENSVDAGILPDSPFYFFDTFIEKVSLGNDPERALEFRQEKIAEVKALAEKKNAEDMKKALERASEYGKVLEKEVTPAMETEVKEVAEIQQKILQDISADIPEIEEEVVMALEQDKRIALAAQLSSTIKQLCEKLSTLDPKEYQKVCKTSNEEPRWQRDLDQKLTEEQKEHARLFAAKLKECYETQGENCDCKGMNIQSFEDLCIRESTRAFNCKKGDEVSCQMTMEQDYDLRDYVPKYLYPALEELKKDFEKHQEKQFQRFEKKEIMLPPACVTQGITSPEECGKLMRKDSGQFEGKHREMFMQRCLEYTSKEKCEQYFEQEKRGELFYENNVDFMAAPCREAGITSLEECQKYMSKEFGKKDDFGSMPDFAGKPERIEEFGRDCHALQNTEEKIRCFEEFYSEARGRSGDDFSKDDRMRDQENKEQHGSEPFEGDPEKWQKEESEKQYEENEKQDANSDSSNEGSQDAGSDSSSEGTKNPESSSQDSESSGSSDSDGGSSDAESSPGGSSESSGSSIDTGTPSSSEGVVAS